LTLVITICLLLLMPSVCGCAKNSVIYVDSDRRVISVLPGDRLITSGGQVYPIDFRGVIITRGRFFELLELESDCCPCP